MRIELTLAHGGRRSDVAVTAPAAVHLAAVRAELARACGAEPDAVFWTGDRALAATAELGSDGLRTGSVVTVGSPVAEPPRPGILSLHVVGGPDAGRRVALERGRLVIGRGSGCDVVLADVDASRQHATIDVTASSILVCDLGSTNGTYVDGARVGGDGRAIRPGDLIRIGDTLLAVSAPDDVPAALHIADDGSLLMLRPPRRAPLLDGREVVRPVRASSTRPRSVQWITALLPAAAGGTIAWLTHSPQFLLFALLSPLMMVSTSLGDRVHWRRSRRRDAASFARRSAEADRQIVAGLLAETAARRSLAPDPAAVLRLVSLPSSRIWERCRGDADVLRVRVGMADLASELRAREGAVVGAAGTVNSVPLGVDLRDGPLGVAGPSDVVGGIGRWLVGQLAVLHSPTDLQLALLLSPDAAEGWHWARWLPHLQCRVAASEGEWAPLVNSLTTTVDQRRNVRGRDGDGWRGPWLVIVIDRAATLADVPGLAALLERGPAVGLTAICLDGEIAGLPTFCPAVAHVVGDTGTRLSVRMRGQPADVTAVADLVPAEWADRVGRGLAPLVDAGAPESGALPDRCRLGDILGADHFDADAIARRWSAATGTAHAALGMSADGPLQVDLVTDGPHALIAGTTGAGKSELLQTLVVGLAANHPPDDLNFLLIDYKGGAAFADCARLPHAAGLVTDLDTYLTARALRSLNSELRRRERLFAEAGAADLAAYRAAAPTTPVARLIIVVDEFAALAHELPDFVRGLVGIAQRGRSLGVHLVLATQRPGTAVSAEIRANTSLRISLRVTDPAESTDVIDTADAALIERSRPGRAYARLGCSLTCFQTAHPGAINRPDAAEVAVDVLDEWRRPHRAAESSGERTDLSALVDVLSAAAKQTGRAAATTPWLPPLPDRLGRDDLEGDPENASVAFGLIDLPTEQRRATMSIDLDAGSSLLAAGTARCGRTTLLSSIALGAAARLGPDRLQLYVIDPAGALAAVTAPLPHCATAVGADDPALAVALLRRIDQACSHRTAARNTRPELPPPAMLLLIDGWDAVLASLGDVEAASCTDLLNGLLRAGPAAGLSVVVTGDRTTLAPRFSGGFAAKIVLRLADVGDYGLIGIAPRDVASSMPPGRAYRSVDAAAVQIAHPGLTPDNGAARREALRIAQSWSALATDAGTDPPAIRIRPLPLRLSVRDLPAQPGRLCLGVVGDEAVPLHIDAFAGAGRMLVAGPPRSGKSTLLQSLLVQARVLGLAAIVAASSRSPLADAARHASVPVIDPADRADAIGPVPAAPTLLLLDDNETFADSAVVDRLTSWLRATDAPLAAVVAGRADDLATSYRGVGAEVRRSHCGILLRPGPVDGELLGVRLPRRHSTGPVGRGVVVGDPKWDPMFDAGEPLPIQVAQP